MKRKGKKVNGRGRKKENRRERSGNINKAKRKKIEK